MLFLFLVFLSATILAISSGTLIGAIISYIGTGIFWRFFVLSKGPVQVPMAAVKQPIFFVIVWPIAAFMKCFDLLQRRRSRISHIQIPKDHPFKEELNEVLEDCPQVEKTVRYLFRALPPPDDRKEGVGEYVPPDRPINTGEEELDDSCLFVFYKQFFNKFRTGAVYVPIRRIKKEYGQSPEERIGLSSGGYYRLFTTYWTLSIKADDLRLHNLKKYGYAVYCNLDAIIREVELHLAAAFFPTPGPAEVTPKQRADGVKNLLNLFAPDLTIKDLYEGAVPENARWPILRE